MDLGVKKDVCIQGQKGTTEETVREQIMKEKVRHPTVDCFVAKVCQCCHSDWTLY